MKKTERPVPYPYRSKQWGQFVEFRTRYEVQSRREAMRTVTAINHAARERPLPGERCGARRKYDGQPCEAPAMTNGRCKLHGGKSTGPKTAEGRAVALRNLRPMDVW